MTCQGCEARRKWMKEQYERSKERMRLCIERLTGRDASSNEQPKPSDDRSKQSVGRTE